MRKILLILLCGGAFNAYAGSNVCTEKKPVVEFKMVYNDKNIGNIDVVLDKAEAPKTVANFEQYVDSGFYNGKIFHRVIPHFMVQGGGFDKNMQEAKTNAPIENEANNSLKNDKYTIAMARTQDPNSASAQFFINTKDNQFLNYSSDNPGYTVFGKVIKGQKVVDQIEQVPTTDGPLYQNVPIKPVVIKSAKLICK